MEQKDQTAKTSWSISILSLILFIVISLSAGYIGTLLQGDSIDNWYRTIDKPAFNPPNWVFGPVWSILYVLIGIAAYLDWRRRWSRSGKIALTVFAIQLILNTLWTGIFFGLENPGLALIEIIVLLITIIVWIYFSYKTDKRAGLILFPYLAWVSFAAVLNASIWMLN